MAKCLGRIRFTSEVAADTDCFAAVPAFANAWHESVVLRCEVVGAKAHRAVGCHKTGRNGFHQRVVVRS
ncbi:hypothetical protein N9M83_00945 [Candidatus Poseidonia alphae]|uniref:hypothetical protein n=1 Tax=Candidatus Poseidonia alphae TaxID=1915863 RepID=UPI0023110FF4|nr:hypothetical protein [Candidatus Poseidonia alphae]MDA8758786.1 hypothetical protein [Candidatus Poseidonia alphae]